MRMLTLFLSQPEQPKHLRQTIGDAETVKSPLQMPKQNIGKSLDNMLTNITAETKYKSH